MNKTAKILMMSAVISFAAFKTNAQVIVRVRPARPTTVVVKRPPAPSPKHVWVTEEWVPQGKSYVWHGGYWAAPARPGSVFVQGHWKNTRHGWIWRPGHWR